MKFCVLSFYHSAQAYILLQQLTLSHNIHASERENENEGTNLLKNQNHLASFVKGI